MSLLTSHITHVTSNITHHTSHITHHTSHMSHQTSHVTAKNQMERAWPPTPARMKVAPTKNNQKRGSKHEELSRCRILCQDKVTLAAKDAFQTDRPSASLFRLSSECLRKLLNVAGIWQPLRMCLRRNQEVSGSCQIPESCEKQWYTDCSRQVLAVRCERFKLIKQNRACIYERE
jgi:hypothetical protein